TAISTKEYQNDGAATAIPQRQNIFPRYRVTVNVHQYGARTRPRNWGTYKGASGGGLRFDLYILRDRRNRDLGKDFCSSFFPSKKYLIKANNTP
ncbi:MAG: hypothetical protein ACREUY_08235, partial [Burkholderiales bacterium]